MGKLYQGLKKRDCFSNRKQLFTTVKLVSLIQLYVQFVWKFVPEDVELIPEVLRQGDGEEEDDEGHQGEEVAHVVEQPALRRAAQKGDLLCDDDDDNNNDDKNKNKMTK